MEAKVENNVKQYVVFRIATEEYGVDIHKITTIEKDMNIARVPKTPSYIKGVINLRGEIIPVMDVRKRFNLEVMETTDDTRIIILKIEDNSIGIIVDAVAEVISLSDGNIENVSNFTRDISLEYIIGVGKVEGRLITLINLEKFISELTTKNESGVG